MAAGTQRLDPVVASPSVENVNQQRRAGDRIVALETVGPVLIVPGHDVIRAGAAVELVVGLRKTRRIRHPGIAFDVA